VTIGSFIKRLWLALSMSEALNMEEVYETFCSWVKSVVSFGHQITLNQMVEEAMHVENL